MQTEITKFTQRKNKISYVVAKAPTAFLQKVIDNKAGYDMDIVIAAHFELERRS